MVDGIVSAPSPLCVGSTQEFRPKTRFLQAVLQPLSDVISNRGCDFHKCAEDIEL